MGVGGCEGAEFDGADVKLLALGALRASAAELSGTLQRTGEIFVRIYIHTCVYKHEYICMKRESERERKREREREREIEKARERERERERLGFRCRERARFTIDNATTKPPFSERARTPTCMAVHGS